MAQHDYSLSNQSGAAFRSDLNNMASAIVSLNSGASEPSTTFAYMWWADTTNGLRKQRNAANSGWLVRGTLKETFAISRSSNTILGVGDYRRTILATAAFTQTLTAAATLGDGWEVNYRNASTGKVVIDPNSSETIDGKTTITLDPGQSCRIVCNGTAFYTIGRSGIVLASSQATTSGTSVDFTIPAGVRRVNVMFNIVDATDTDDVLIQLGDSGGLETTGYSAMSHRISQGSGVGEHSYTTGFGVYLPSTSTGLRGAVALQLLDASANTWVASGTLHQLTGGVNWSVVVSGLKSLSAELTQVSLVTATAFTGGAAAVSYE